MEMQNILSQFYENYDEDNRLSSGYGMVEYLTTMRYIEKYLRPGMRILEIGAGGRYSHALARKGGMCGDGVRRHAGHVRLPWCGVLPVPLCRV